jgi:hypothetical protein
MSTICTVCYKVCSTIFQNPPTRMLQVHLRTSRTSMTIHVCCVVTNQNKCLCIWPSALGVVCRGETTCRTAQYLSQDVRGISTMCMDDNANAGSPCAPPASAPPPPPPPPYSRISFSENIMLPGTLGEASQPAIAGGQLTRQHGVHMSMRNTARLSLLLRMLHARYITYIHVGFK